MILRKIMVCNFSYTREIYLEFTEILETKISKAIRNNKLSTIKKLIAECGGKIYSKNVICKLKRIEKS